MVTANSGDSGRRAFVLHDKILRMNERNWLLSAGIEIILLGLAVSFLLGRSGHQMAATAPLQDGLRVIYKSINSPLDIEPLHGPAVPPIAYTSVISFASLDVKIKKRKFFDMMLPAILISRYKLSRLRRRILACIRKKKRCAADRQWLEQQMDRFEADNDRQLLQKTEDHPVSIILAQAALESGWGESRFFVKNNNVFGVWSFNPEEPRVRAMGERQGRKIYVKKYKSLIESVDDYFLTIARGPYRRFRWARTREDNPFQLINHLTRYSEQRGEYVQRLREVIEKNDLQRYDSYYLDPRYLMKKMGG